MFSQAKAILLKEKRKPVRVANGRPAPPPKKKPSVWREKDDPRGTSEPKKEGNRADQALPCAQEQGEEAGPVAIVMQMRCTHSNQTLSIPRNGGSRARRDVFTTCARN